MSIKGLCEYLSNTTKTNVRKEKYYLSDLSFYFATNTDNRIEYGPAAAKKKRHHKNIIVFIEKGEIF